MLPPRVWGLIPRLASQMRIERVNAIASWQDGQGLMLSLELLDCEATGFQNEPGNFICRSAALRSMTCPHTRPSHSITHSPYLSQQKVSWSSEDEVALDGVLIARNALMQLEHVCAE